MAALAQLIAADPAVVEVATIYAAGQPLAQVLESCIDDDHVPATAAMRLRESGMAKRAQWQRTWKLQHEEDIGAPRRHEVPDEPAKYANSDYLRSSYWRLRGKFDMPHERFISYPQESSGKKTLLLGWAGWNEVQRAEAFATLIASIKAPRAESVLPLLAGLDELLPWLTWSVDDRTVNGRPAVAAHYREFISQQLKKWGMTTEDLQAWRPPKSRRGRPPKNSVGR